MANSTYRSPDARKGIRAARKAREELGLIDGCPIPDVLACVERLAAPVAVLDLDDGIAGAYLVRPAGRLIFVNRIHAVQRQRFTLAHELGHHSLDHPADLDTPRDLADFSQDPAEVQANWFAAEFLMPFKAAQGWADEHFDGLPTLEDVVRFSCEFGVSAKAACVRLQTADRIPDERGALKLHAEIDECEHYGLAEKLELAFVEDELAAIKEDGPRLPPALAGNPLALYTAGDVDERAVAAAVGRAPGEVRDIVLDAGLPVGV